MTNYSYDTLNRLTNLKDFSSNSSTFNYDQLGRRTSLGRPNGVTTSYSYDNLSRLLQVLHQKGSTLGEGAAYTYDNAGNRLTRAETTPGKHGNVTKTAAYTYDAIYQLTQAATDGNLTDNNTYDAVGNRLSDWFGGTYSYNNSNQLTSYPVYGYSWTYDSNGNDTSETQSTNTTTYNWDFENRLTSVTLPNGGGTVTFKYDPFGRRIEKISSSGTTIYTYDGDNIVEQLDASGNATARYTQGLGIDGPLEVYEGGKSYYYHADGLGSVVALTKSTGTAANTYFEYNTFGADPDASETVPNRFRFTGREWDSETSLYYYRARYYDPLFGRFLSEDPAGFIGGYNFYRYVSNSPGNDTDPSGLWSPQAHDQMIWNALHFCGVSNADIYQIQLGSRYVDINYQGAEYSYVHSMSNGSAHQSALAAETERDSFVMAETRAATAEVRAGQITQGMFTLGIAMHPVMDMTSPAHVVNGAPVPWCGESGCPGDRLQVLEHSPDDRLPVGIERTQGLNARPDIQDVENRLIRSGYEAVTGRQLRCGCDHR